MKVRQRQIQPGFAKHQRGLLWPAAQRCLAAVLAVTFFLATQAGPAGVGGKRDLELYTQNLYVGSEFDGVLGLDPADPEYAQTLVQAVTQTYYTMLFSRPDLRMAAVAQTIAEQLPDVVTLQEVALLRRQSPGDLIVSGTVPATAVDVDFLGLLLQALEGQGAAYKVAVVAPEFDLELPMLNLETGIFDDVRLTDHEVILVRADLPPGYLRIANPQSAHFSANLAIPGFGLEITRGWCSVDVFTRGRTLRVINAHLEEETQPAIQAAQALELLAGPANVNMPVILAGDFNSDANRFNSTLTYDLLLNEGFADSWDAANPGVIGLTWGHDPFLADPTVGFVWRLDYILYRGRILDPLEAQIVDRDLSGALPPLWASDHAGVITTLRLR